MNILYISKLDGRPWIGPTYSVPKQISGQRKYDNVLWYNLYSNKDSIEGGKPVIDEWRKLNYYVDLEKYPKGIVSGLPSPFNNPDLIIVEQGYPYSKSKIKTELTHGKYNYIVVPRGELTRTAQSKKKLKKIIGNIIIGFKPFMNNAVAIQCLTKQEADDTSAKWNDRKIILPNGADVPDFEHQGFSEGGVRAVSIGRIEPYQKGLDLLIQASASIKELLIAKKIQFDIYGSDKEGKLASVKQMVTNNGLDSIFAFHDAVFGEDKIDVLRKSDVFMMPSRFEGHPTGLLEALAFGLPCLATDGSNMRDEIEAYDAGWGAENSVDSVKNALLEMIDSSIDFGIKSQNARKLAELYDWNAIAQRSHYEYEKLIKGGKI